MAELFDTTPFVIDKNKIIDVNLLPELWLLIYFNKDNHLISISFEDYEGAVNYANKTKSIRAVKIINSKDIFY